MDQTSITDVPAIKKAILDPKRKCRIQQKNKTNPNTNKDTLKKANHYRYEKKILFLLLAITLHSIPQENSNLRWFICKIATKGDIIVALDYKSTNNGRQLYFGRR
jgi:hypothetical protein